MIVNFKHGRCGTREYYTWTGLRNRCLNPRNRAYHNYGGRGIKVCQRWLDSFTNFYSDMGPKPPGMTLERVDNNGDYEPKNCRWASRKEQAGNTRRTRKVTLNGVTKPIGWWADGAGLSRAIVIGRLNAGWDISAALSRRGHKLDRSTLNK